MVKLTQLNWSEKLGGRRTQEDKGEKKEKRSKVKRGDRLQKPTVQPCGIDF